MRNKAFLNQWPVKLGICISAAGAVLLSYAWFFTKYYFQVNRFSIGKTGSKRQLRIVLLTDLHFKQKFWPFHQRLVKKINELRPHLILIGGDLIDEHGQPGPARAFFQRLRADVPRVAIPGNHDNKNGVSRATLRKIIEAQNGRLLVNETTRVNCDGIMVTITGLEDFIEKKDCFAGAVHGVGKEDHHFLLVHSPLQQEHVLKEIERINQQRSTDRQLRIQYIFAGHTHGGQVRLHDFVPVLPEKSGSYVNGWYNEVKPFLYVSKGFGTSAVPFRLGARPEITLFSYGV